jgi:hypothetical protein
MADEPSSTENSEGLKTFVKRRLREKEAKRQHKKKPSKESLAGTQPKKGRYGFPQQDDTVNWD